LDDAVLPVDVDRDAAVALLLLVRARLRRDPGRLRAQRVQQLHQPRVLGAQLGRLVGGGPGLPRDRDLVAHYGFTRLASALGSAVCARRWLRIAAQNK